MRTKDQCLDEAAKKIMLDWNLSGFKTSFPKLYESFMEAMEAYRSQPSGAKSPHEYLDEACNGYPITPIFSPEARMATIDALTAQAANYEKEDKVFEVRAFIEENKGV